MAKLGDNASDDDDGERVAEYLRRHPDFLVRYPKILDGLTPPAQYSGDGVVDMQQFMLERLRGIVADLDWSAFSPGMRVTMSAGVATLRDIDTADTFLARADRALYSAKAQGRNSIVTS